MASDMEVIKARRELRRVQSGCKNPKWWCGSVTCHSDCPAMIAHGPGHQSASHCELKGPHEQHQYEGPRTVFRWHGDAVFSGFFDESPE
jgi:hypothetical protein